MKTKFVKFAGTLGGLALSLALAGPALANSMTYTPGTVILDNNLNGVSDTETFSSAIVSITSIQVNLDITGGYDGDFYAYLTHGTTGFAVLLNRIGVNSSSQFGSYDVGMNVTFSDSAAANIHDSTATGAALTGTWQPDGRNIGPLSAPGTIASTPSTADLSTFNGMDPNGDWTLFIADTSPVGIGTLKSWELDINGSTGVGSVPDAANTIALLGMGAGLLLVLKHRLNRKQRAGDMEAAG